ncbi:MAG: flagellin [Burkholderiales bacterium]
MRSATAYAAKAAVDSINDRQAQLAKAQSRVSSGLRVERPSDDPAAAAEAERMRSRDARIGTEMRVIGQARQMLSGADTAIADANDVLQSARDTLLKAGNGAVSSQDRQSLGMALQQMRDQLLGIANRGDGVGGYVFGGQGSGAAPFTGNGLNYSAPAGTVLVGQEMASEVAVDGRSSLAAVQGPGGPENIFARLDAAITALSDSSLTQASAAATAMATVDSVDRSLAALSTARTRVGERMNALEMHEKALESGRIDTVGRLSDLVDVDFAQAISQLSQGSTAAEAAMKSYAQIARLSLFSYL